MTFMHVGATSLQKKFTYGPVRPFRCAAADSLEKLIHARNLVARAFIYGLDARSAREVLALLIHVEPADLPAHERFGGHEHDVPAGTCVVTSGVRDVAAAAVDAGLHGGIHRARLAVACDGVACDPVGTAGVARGVRRAGRKREVVLETEHARAGRGPAGGQHGGHAHAANDPARTP